MSRNDHHDETETQEDTKAREAFEFLVHSITGDFHRAGIGWETAFSLSHALNDLLKCRASAFRLSDVDHAAMSAAIDLAWQAADDRMPAHLSRFRLVDGMEAAAAIVDRWRRPPRERDCGRYARTADVFARAEILKNDFHSIGLEEDIARRAADREASRRQWREDVIAAMAVLEAEHPAASVKRRAA